MPSQIYIGAGVGQDKHGRPIDPHAVSQVVAKIEKQAAVMFGGFLTVRGSGGWVEPRRGQLIHEPGLAMIIYSPMSDPEVRPYAERLADNARDGLGQEAAVLAITNVDYLRIQ